MAPKEDVLEAVDQLLATIPEPSGSWTAPTVPALSAGRGSVPAEGSSSADILEFCFLARGWDRSGGSDTGHSDTAQHREVLALPWLLTDCLQREPHFPLFLHTWC